MCLAEYLQKLSGESKQAVADFARRCDTTVGQLRQVAGGHRRAGESLAINIERESRGAVMCDELRPDVDWNYLRSTQPKNKQSAA